MPNPQRLSTLLAKLARTVHTSRDSDFAPLSLAKKNACREASLFQASEFAAHPTSGIRWGGGFAIPFPFVGIRQAMRGRGPSVSLLSMFGRLPIAQPFSRG